MKNNRNEMEAMGIICNIQTMQQIIYKEQFKYEQFNYCTIEELRTLQESLIIIYNKQFHIIAK